MTRTGKIARLPHNLRHQLNLRILDNEPGVHTLAWLNALPEVQAILSRDFAARPISDHNLSDWKQGGYVEWLNRAQATDKAISLADYSREITETLGASPADHLSAIVATELAALLADLSAGGHADPAETLRTLTQITKNLAALRRGDQSATRIQLTQARLAVTGARAEEHVVHKFRDWMNKTNGWQHIQKESLTDEQQIARMTELLFGKPISPDDIKQFIKTESASDTTDDPNLSNANPPEPIPPATN